ncbi:hypothetical protein NEHOM01_1443 [Nematocida homosporus]|uniref:uncharacterized protein n=1 Tax=Nematocida homosporus TaxID=1912981 RepID=UPI00221EC5B7|nr:uncharacterized protein NEHOM01_1443 [Nematocida homosporus]KAI5186389.1 hypothetical protein NEHOM01_1443 [Nematocida homosporus]
MDKRTSSASKSSTTTFMFVPWVIYYLLAATVFLDAFHAGWSTSLPFSMTNDPKMYFIFVFTYLLVSIFALGPSTMLSRDEMYRVLLVKRTMIITLTLNLVLIFVLAMWGQDSEFHLLALMLLVLLQAVGFRETFLVMFIDQVYRAPLNIYIYVSSNMSNSRDGQFEPGMPTLSLLKRLVFVGLMTVVIIMSSIKHIGPHPGWEGLFQVFHAAWTIQIMHFLWAANIAVHCLLKITSPTAYNTGSARKIAFSKCFANLDIIVYLALLGLLFTWVDIVKMGCGYPIWKQETRMSIEAFFKKYFTSFYFYYIYRLKTIVVASLIFEIPPRAAVHKLIQITNNSERPFMRGLQNGNSDRTVQYPAIGFLVMVLCPVVIMRYTFHVTANEPLHGKLLFLLGWSTYTTASLGYLTTEIIHTSVLLAHSQNISLSRYWRDEHLASLQL